MKHNIVVFLVLLALFLGVIIADGYTGFSATLAT